MRGPFSKTFYSTLAVAGVTLPQTGPSRRRADRVAIFRQLREAVFEPADISRMTAAYDATLKLVAMKDRNDPATELIAAKIIQLYRQGERDPPRLCARAIKELGIPMPD